MSKDKPNVKKIINDILSNPEQTKELFNIVQLRLSERQKSITDAQALIEKLKPLVKDYPHYSTIFDLVNSIYSTNKEYNDTFQFIYYILEILVIKGHNQKPLPDAKLEYNPKQLLTEEDRINLDWLKKYLKHSNGEDIGQ